MKGQHLSLSLGSTALLVLSIVAIDRSAVAQKEEAQPPCDKEQALLLIRQQLDEARAVEKPETRIGILIRAADTLWPQAEDVSRRAFQDAYELADKHFHEQGAQSHLEGRLRVGGIDQRFVVMAAISKRDPVWARRLAERVAEEFRRETEGKADDAGVQSNTAPTSSDNGENISDRLLTLAVSVLPVDRATAIDLARRSIALGPSHLLPVFLFQLFSVDQTAADQLFQSGLSAYSGGPIEGLFYLTVYPFALNLPAGPVDVRMYYQLPEAFSPRAGAQQSLLAALFRRADAAIGSPNNQTVDSSGLTEGARLLMSLQRLEPLIAQQQPALLERAASLKALLSAALSSELRLRATQLMRGYQLEPDTGMSQHFLEGAEREPNPDRRDMYLCLGILRAPEGEPADRLLDLVKGISDEKLRDGITNWLYFTLAQRAIKAELLDDAKQFADRVDLQDWRAYLYYNSAADAISRLDDRARATELLDEAAAMANKAPKTNETARALLGVAYLFAKFDQLRAAQVAQDAVKTINSVAEPDLTSTSVIQRIEGKQFSQYASLQMPGVSIENVFRELASFDFQGALVSAKSLEDRSLRAYAIIALADSCLARAKQPPPGPHH
jgi:hypothetical protein